MDEKTLDIVNFRDIGGYTGLAGMLKPNYFYRSAQLTDLTDAQKTGLVADKKIKTIIDFRTDEEVKNTPDSDVTGITYRQIDVLGAGSGAPSFDAMLQNAEAGQAFMLDTYAELVLSKQAQQAYHDFLMHLIEQPEAIVFHCFAGKDRTGYAAALILKIAGIDNQTILEDYLLTNDMRRAENERAIAEIQTHVHATPEDLVGLKKLFEVDASYLKQSVQTIEASFGTFENYLQKGLALPADYIQRFRDIYLEA